MQEKEKDYNDIIQKQNEKVEHMFSIEFLTPENTTLERTEGGLLRAVINGEEHKRVRPVRCFPFTNHNEYISLREGNGNESHELGMLRNIDSLGEDAAAMIKEQLDIMYFMPVIQHIDDIREEYGYSYWTVRTDRGAARFTVPMGGNSIQRLSDTRMIIKDLDGNRFEIPDSSVLSAAELKKLDLYL